MRISCLVNELKGDSQQTYKGCSWLLMGKKRGSTDGYLSLDTGAEEQTYVGKAGCLLAGVHLIDLVSVFQKSKGKDFRHEYVFNLIFSFTSEAAEVLGC